MRLVNSKRHGGIMIVIENKDAEYCDKNIDKLKNYGSFINVVNKVVDYISATCDKIITENKGVDIIIINFISAYVNNDNDYAKSILNVVTNFFKLKYHYDDSYDFGVSIRNAIDSLHKDDIEKDLI